MEIRMIIGFVMVVLWAFLRNYERKTVEEPSSVPPAPAPPLPSAKGRAFPKTASNRQGQSGFPEKNINKNTTLRAAFSTTPASTIQKGGDQEEPYKTERIDEQINDFAEDIRLKIRTADCAREAFIYHEIFQRRV